MLNLEVFPWFAFGDEKNLVYLSSIELFSFFWFKLFGNSIVFTLVLKAVTTPLCFGFERLAAHLRLRYKLKKGVSVQHALELAGHEDLDIENHVAESLSDYLVCLALISGFPVLGVLGTIIFTQRFLIYKFWEFRTRRLKHRLRAHLQKLIQVCTVLGFSLSVVFAFFIYTKKDFLMFIFIERQLQEVSKGQMSESEKLVGPLLRLQS